LKDELKTQISMADLASGMYFISIFNGEVEEDFKIIKL